MENADKDLPQWKVTLPLQSGSTTFRPRVCPLSGYSRVCPQAESASDAGSVPETMGTGGVESANACFTPISGCGDRP